MTQSGPELDPVDPDNEVDMPITVTDRRVIDPDTGEVRRPAGEPAPGSEEAVPSSVADEEIAELTAALQRERAQFANFKRRAAEEKQGSVAFGKQVLIEKLLPLLDDLDRAREHGDLEDGPMKSIADKLGSTLTGEGLAKFGEPGDAFAPELHEAVQHDGDGANPVLGQVYRSGYRLGEKVIRTAMVTVTDPAPGAAPAAAPETEETGAQ
ncbi:nucleotide exchange factor GrpE [Gordonia sp. CPCC 205515]|uniref:nucleotide exchange factor GrpE n=1 Tax=Gordonia sp. CPCC 205515 TaxID=3140791 RepID=UPI003AF40061